jgi:PAS domain S-box-containing protein
MPFTKQPLRVLLVDDNPADRALVAREVRRDHPDAEIIEAGTPSELDAALATDRLSLGVFDYSIGWTNGVDVLRRMRAIDPDVPVILFTGSLGEEEAADAIKIGFNDFILKQVDRLPRLRASIDALLSQKAERQARKRAEARYEALFQNVTVGLFAARNDGTLEDGNGALVRQLGAASEADIRGRNILDFIGSDEARSAWRRMAAGETANGIAALEVELSGAGETRWALLDAHPADAARRQIEGVLTDITPLHNALDQRAALLGEVHHRVHNNLQIVQSLLAFQSRRFRTPGALVTADEVRNAFDEVASRIQTLSLVQQRLYRAEDYTAVDFGAYLTSLADALLRLRGRTNITTSFDLEPIRVPIDKAMPLGLIANELLTNTLKHGFPEGRPGTIRIAFRRDGERVALTIADDGVGVETAPATTGDGVGSRIVPRLATQLGATIETVSDGGYSTTIRFEA